MYTWLTLCYEASTGAEGGTREARLLWPHLPGPLLSANGSQWVMLPLRGVLPGMRAGGGGGVNDGGLLWVLSYS